MASKELSALASASTLDGTELVHVVQGGNSRKATVDHVRLYATTLDMVQKSGYYLTPSNPYNAGTITTSTANSIRLTGITLASDIEVDLIGIRFNASGANGKALVYVQDDAVPTTLNLVHSSGSLVAASGYVSESWSYTFSKGKRYFIGAVLDGAISIGAVNGGSVTFGLFSPTQTSFYGTVALSHTFANPAPSTISLGATSFLGAGLVPATPMRMV